MGGHDSLHKEGVPWRPSNLGIPSGSMIQRCITTRRHAQRARALPSTIERLELAEDCAARSVVDWPNVHNNQDAREPFAVEGAVRETPDAHALRESKSDQVQV